MTEISEFAFVNQRLVQFCSEERCALDGTPEEDM